MVALTPGDPAQAATVCFLLDGKVVSFSAVHPDGRKEVGILGWEPDTKRLVETGYGTHGTYYQLVYKKVTMKDLEGTWMSREPDGKKLGGLRYILWFTVCLRPSGYPRR